MTSNTRELVAGSHCHENAKMPKGGWPLAWSYGVISKNPHQG